jgi:type II secretory pathway pseudopilin PulG
VQRLKEENGMTLVVVLLTITIFTVLGLAVVGASMNNTKQVQNTEADIKTTDIAEMGVQHYQNLLLDFFHEQISAKKETYQNLILNKYNETGEITDQFIEDLELQLTNELIDAYKNSSSSPLKTLVNISVDDQTKSSYIIETTGSTITCIICNSTQEEKRIELTYQSKGYTNQHLEKLLSVKFSFNYHIDKDGIITEDLPVNYETIIEKPTEGIILCNESDFKKKTGPDSGSNGQVEFDALNCEYDETVSVERPSGIKNSNLIFGKGVTFDQVLSKGIISSTLYITGDLTLNKQINGIEKSQIFVRGTTDGWSKFGTLNQGIHSSTIVIIGNITFGENNDKFKGLDHSSIYVRGIADFTNMEFVGFDDSSKICIDGESRGVYDQTKPIYVKSDNEELFLEKCSLDQFIEVTDQFLDWDEDVTPIVDYSN